MSKRPVDLAGEITRDVLRDESERVGKGRSVAVSSEILLALVDRIEELESVVADLLEL